MSNLAKIIDDIATSSKLEKFFSSLKHADLPTGWQKDQGIVDAAGKLYREMGTDSPFFKAYVQSKPKNEFSIDYGMSHRPSGPFDAAPAHNVSANGMYPEDFYSNKGLHYYGTGEDVIDKQSYNAIRSVLNLPNEKVTMYRAVPNIMTNSEKAIDLDNLMSQYLKRGNIPSKHSQGFTNGSDWFDWAYKENARLRSLPDEEVSKPSINIGDWVTLSRQYAKEHGESNLNNDFKILSKKVPARDVFTNADSMNEFGYFPKGLDPEVGKSVYNRGTFDPSDPNILRTAAPWLAGGGLAGGGLAAGSMLGANEAQATPRLSPDLAAWAKSAEKSQALQEPVWSPSDLFVAPIGAAGVPAKAAAMALDAPVSMALNEVLDYINSGATAVADWWRR